MAHYTLVRNGRNLGTKALSDQMADLLAARGVEVIPTAEPVHAAWKPGSVSRRQRLAQERATHAEVIALGKR